jgi:hypothetical protein
MKSLTPIYLLVILSTTIRTCPETRNDLTPTRERGMDFRGQKVELHLLG